MQFIKSKGHERIGRQKFSLNQCLDSSMFKVFDSMFYTWPGIDSKHCTTLSFCLSLAK